MKKAIYIIASLAIVSSIGFGMIQTGGDTSQVAGTKQLKEGTYQIATTHAKIPFFEEFSTLENYSEIIVIGHAVGQQGTYQVKTDTGAIIDKLDKTPFQIDKVFKGNIFKQSTITVMEDGRIEDGVYHNLEGYVKMNDSNQYLLFLRKTGDNTYAVNGSYQGKFNVDKPGKVSNFTSNSISPQQLGDVEYIGENTEHYNKLKDKAISKYTIKAAD